MANSLINETSPYLLQHAHNPVQWYAWNEDSLKLARDKNIPIFLSIGYSACHWCHVMAHESFENEEVARIMNENFVNIKVDREERPDLDDIYQKVSQIATGQGGWPLSVFLTPDQKPFYVGTYFPVLDSYGRPGFGSVLKRLAQAWREDSTNIARSAENILGSLRGVQKGVERACLDRSVLDEAAVNLYQMGDAVYGGFGKAPKFPNAAVVSFLFRYSKISGISKFQELALRTLNRMARGGIFDQIGGGFHRYSTDARWLVPHFEKMLYDNALLPVSYAEAYQITREPLYLDVMCKTLDFMLREMRSPSGGFYSAIDADSEGEEGLFYTWTKKEVMQLLGAEADIFCMYYDVTDGGNLEGRTILCRNTNYSAVALRTGRTEDQVRCILEEAEHKLLHARSKRVRPGTDDKILTSWNALAVTALAKGYRVSGKLAYLDAAEKCVSFILDSMYDNGLLLHSYRNGRAGIAGYLEDYAFLGCALLDLFEITAQVRYLRRVEVLVRYLLDHFWNAERGTFFMTDGRHEELIIRPMNPHDLSVPSGNSLAAGLLLRLYRFTHERQLLDVASAAAESHALQGAENPFGFGYLLNVICMHLQEPVEVLVLGERISEMARAVGRLFLPEGTLVTVPSQERLDELARYALFAGKEFPQAGARAYVCRGSTCSLPIENPEKIENLL